MQNIKLDDQLNNFRKAFNNKNFEVSEQLALSLTNNFPQHPFGWKARSFLSRRKGNIDQALIFIQKSIDIFPEDPESHNNQGTLFLQIKKYCHAITCFKTAIDKKKNYFEAYFNMGIAFENLNDFDMAMKLYKRSISINKNFISAYNNLGTVLIKINKLEEAEEVFKKIIFLNNADEKIFTNLGYVNEKMNKLDYAEQNYKKAIQLNPNFSEAFNNLGNILKKKNKLNESEHCFKKAIKIKPDFADAYRNLGILNRQKGNLDKSIQLFNKAIEIRKSFPAAENLKYGTENEMCNFDITKNIDVLTKNLGVTTESVDPFNSLSWVDNPDLQLKRAKKYCKENFKMINKKIYLQLKNKTKIVNIGYFCSDFYDFPTMHLLIRQLEIHNRENFKIFAFSFGKLINDEMHERIVLAVDEFIDVKDLSIKEISKIVCDKKITISIDLNGFTRNSRTEIFQNKVSPIQINYLGYPSTMGAEFIDYIVADPTLINSEYRKFYSEKVIFMPKTYQPNDNLRKIDHKDTKRSDFNLPENKFVLCCFNQSYKITHNEFNIWLKILTKVPNSVLWLLKDNKWAEQNLINKMEQFGLDPSRLIFAKKTSNSKHLARQKHADLFVDTFNYNAHTTASDALYVGLPIVTKIGKQFSARVCASLLNAIGLSELITTTEQEYENLILDLALNNEKLKKIKKKLSINKFKKPLFDSEAYTKHFEQALKRIHKIYLNNETPQDIWVN